MFKDFINKVRASDEKTKKFWVFIFSGFTMAIIAGLWAFYLDVSVARVNPMGETQVAAMPDGRQVTDGSGFFATLSSSFGNFWEQVKKIGAPLAKKNTIVIENDQKNFLPKDLEPLPITKLP